MYKVKTRGINAITLREVGVCNKSKKQCRLTSKRQFGWPAINLSSDGSAAKAGCATHIRKADELVP